MTDVENSDDERYANESFECESDFEAQDMSDFESVSTQDSDDDENDGDLPSVKMNTGPIKRGNYFNNSPNNNKTDVVPFASSSDEESDVIVGQTMAEINTLSMQLEDESPIPHNNHGAHSADDEIDKNSEEEICEEEDDEEEEFKRIKDIEEKYLQRMSAITPKHTSIECTASLEEKQQFNKMQPESENEYEVESEDEQRTIVVGGSTLTCKEDDQANVRPSAEEMCSDRSSETTSSSASQNKIKDNPIDSIDQKNLMQLIQNSLESLKIAQSNDIENNFLKICQAALLNEINAHTVNAPKALMQPENIGLVVLNVLKRIGLTSLQMKGSPETSEQNHISIKNPKEENGSGEEMRLKNEPLVIKVIENNNGIGDHNNTDDDARFDYRITSETPTSFNSDNYVFHANFLKTLSSTNSIDKLRVKPHNRKSMSFSNERMREIERHNQILLRKILTQKPTYTLTSRSSQSSLQKVPSTTNTRLTSSAVNRNKQRKQIYLDNQVLKRKLEAIALRKPPLTS